MTNMTKMLSHHSKKGTKVQDKFRILSFHVIKDAKNLQK